MSAPLGDTAPALVPGRRYLLELVVRTLGALGHEYTQGTADSNETWIDVTVRCGDRVIGRSGGIAGDTSVDPWSKFFNVYMLDREGRRIDRRNPQDIFVPLYNHQVPPGAADLTRVAFELPSDASGPVTVEASVRYRKFDAAYMRYVFGADRREKDTDFNDLHARAGLAAVRAQLMRALSWLAPDEFRRAA
jgi:hypothetical protein